jgi:hypothetical protein
MPHPSGAKGHWVRTDRCVAFVKCPACGAPAGTMCIGTREPFTVSTHHYRRQEYSRRKKQLEPKRSYTVVMEVPCQSDDEPRVSTPGGTEC